MNGGDDIGFSQAFADVDLGSPRQIVARTFARVGRGNGLARRVASIARFLGDPKGAEKVSAAHCAAAVRLAGRLGMSGGVQRALGQIYERWDGKGLLQHLRGPAIDPVARILHVAHVAEVYFRLGGVDGARDEIQRRRGKHFDPDIARFFTRQAQEILAGLSAPSAWDLFLESEPGPAALLNRASLPEVALAFAHFADLKSPFMLGHSAAVAEIASVAAKSAGLTVAERDLLKTAALVHDIGRVAVANGIWDKSGPLNDIERDLVRTLSAETERILRRAAILRPVADLAATAYERLDGSGFHRRLTGQALGKAARILAASDAYVAMTEDRAYRAARTSAQAARELSEEVGRGRLDRDAVRAVLAAGGMRPPSLKRDYPDGLSDREVEVLSLVARGLSNRAIAERLHISPRTVQTHVMHIFDKTGIHGRAAAALYAVDSGLAKNQHFGG